MFDNIVGNKKIIESLISSIKNKKTSHSYLFIGPEGIGKKEIAQEFAKTLLEVNRTNNPDIIFIETEGNVIKINQIREMQLKVQEKPILAKKKVYIINDADKMTVEAQNCLLKTLEEPPEFVTIILIGINENDFLSTIKSRCMIIKFEQIKDEEMKQFLYENYKIENVTKEMLQIFQGSIAKAIELKDKRESYEKINKLIENLEKVDLIETTNEAEVLYKSKEEIQKLLEYINVKLLEIAKTNHKFANCISIVEETKKRLKQNCNYDMCIDNMLWNMWREVN